MELSLHYATVVDNNDTDQKAKIKIRILPEMKDFDDAKLPWYRPFFPDGMSADQFSYNPPENDSKIWVICTDKFLTDGYYLAGAFIDGFFDFSSVQSDLQNISELSNTDYDKLRFTKMPDGTIIFHNDSTGEVGVYHNSGKYVIIDNNGDVHISSDFYNIGDFDIDGDLTVSGSGSFGSATQPVTLFTALQTALNTLLVTLSTHVHTDPISGSTGPPTPPLTTYTSGSVIGLDSAEAQDLDSS